MGVRAELHSQGAPTFPKHGEPLLTWLETRLLLKALPLSDQIQELRTCPQDESVVSENCRYITETVFFTVMQRDVGAVWYLLVSNISRTSSMPFRRR